MLKKSAVFSLFLGLLISGNVYAQNTECRVSNRVSDLFVGDTYLENNLVLRNANNVFTTSDNRFRELAAYLNTLNLPSAVRKAHVVLHKSITLYEAGHTLHHGKPWYDHRGNVVNPAGDNNRLRGNFEANYRAVQIDMLDFRLRHGWGPFVLYENEDDGKGVVNVEAVFLDKNDCWLDSLNISYYRLPLDGNINIDNVDGGNEYLKVMSASTDGNYFSLTGGTGALYPERAKDLRFEWDTRNANNFSTKSGGNYQKPVVAGVEANYISVAVFPHLKEPEIVLDNYDNAQGYHLLVKLPKYFQDGLTATYVALECVDDQVVNVRMVRGKTQRIFPIKISRDSALAAQYRWWSK